MWKKKKEKERSILWSSSQTLPLTVLFWESYLISLYLTFIVYKIKKDGLDQCFPHCVSKVCAMKLLFPKKELDGT